ncbi:MAG TPA: MOSC domain-containing protein [Acidimicrobiales bacterium]
MASVVQLNVSGGGVPKLPVPEIVVEPVTGVVGDVQNERKHHGRPWQALCLWSIEVIDALYDEGHPIGAGAAGENVTIEGLDWATILPGVQLRIGSGDDAVVAEITAFAIPCKKNAQWFRDGDFTRILHDKHPGWSRMYAAVIQGGVVRPGDTVEVMRSELGPVLPSAALNEKWGGW